METKFKVTREETVVWSPIEDKIVPKVTLFTLHELINPIVSSLFRMLYFLSIWCFVLCHLLFICIFAIFSWYLIIILKYHTEECF